VNLGELLDTYNSELWTRFQALGVDLYAGHAIASALANHASNKPLFGFAKQQRERDPRMQKELNIALVHHAREGNAKGLQLCLWAGADAHAPALDLRDPDPEAHADSVPAAEDRGSLARHHRDRGDGQRRGRIDVSRRRASCSISSLPNSPVSSFSS
jgi:hypothetical protein